LDDGNKEIKNSLKLRLKELENDHLPFLCLQYKDSEGVEHSLPAVYLGNADSINGSMVSAIDSSAQTAASSLT
jgi:hypothetical protein